jgi:N utilization substance protein B
MSRRSRARAIALQVLFQEDLTTAFNPAMGDELVQRRLRAEDQRQFARSLVAGVRARRGEVDALIAQVAENWSLTRMAATDRNVLRLGAYELLYTDTPERVAIDEAVELAKRFGTAQSGPFVNGILDRLMHEKETGRQGDKETGRPGDKETRSNEA